MSRFMFSIIFVILIGMATSVSAQQQDPEALPVPDPTRLAPDWAGYLQAEGDTLGKRTEALAQRLDNLIVELDPANAESTRTLFDEVRELLSRYSTVKGLAQPLPPPTTPLAERYDVRSYLDLAVRAHEVRTDANLEREDLNRLKAAQKIARGQYDTLKAEYLALNDFDPARLAMGLRLIGDWLNLALADEEIRRDEARAEFLEASVQRVDSALLTAPDTLVVTDADLDAFRVVAEDAEAESARLYEEAAFARLRGVDTGDNDMGRARRRLHAQKSLDYEVRIRGSELKEKTARTAVALTEFLLAQDPKAVDLQTVEEPLAELRALIKEIEKDERAWRQATERERSAAIAKLSLVAGENAEFSELLRSRIANTDETLQNLGRLNDQLVRSDTLAELAINRVAVERGTIAAWWEQSKDGFEAGVAMVESWANASLFSVNETPVSFLGLLRVVVIVFAAYLVSKMARRALDRTAERRQGMNRASVYTIGRLFHYFILVVGMLVGLSSIGIDFTKFALFVSALGVGIGFGLQAIISNFIAGLIILIDRSLKVGDFVDLGSGLSGEVREINIRSTIVTTNDNIDIVVPNSEFISNRVTNWTYREAFRRVHVTFGVAYGTDKELVRKAVLEAANEVPFTLKRVPNREPQVWLVNFGQSSLDFELVVWLVSEAVKRPSSVNATYCWAIDTALAKYGIEIPFPQRDLHLKPSSEINVRLSSDS